MDTITLGTILQYASYWIAFWTIVHALLPPRETFDGFPGFQRFYNVLLLIVSFYGALNIRQFSVQLYGKLGVPLDPPPTAKVQGFVQGVDATAKAAKVAVVEAAEAVKTDVIKNP